MKQKSFLWFTAFTALAAFLATESICAPPSYAPYAAWRGRARYVEGPHRVKERIRWGNGVTPVGGQVLASGFAAAAIVLGERGGEMVAQPRTSDTQSQIYTYWKQRRISDNDLLGKLNILRSVNDLTPASFSQESTVAPSESPSDSGNIITDFIGLDAELTGTPKALFPVWLKKYRGVRDSWDLLAKQNAGQKLSGSQLDGLNFIRETCSNAIAKSRSVIILKEFSTVPTAWGTGNVKIEKDKLKPLAEVLSEFHKAHKDATDYIKKIDGEKLDPASLGTTAGKRFSNYLATLKAMDELFIEPNPWKTITP